MKSYLILGTKIAVSIALLAFLFVQLDWTALTTKARDMAWWGLPLAVLVLMLAFYLGCVRWALLLRTHQPHYRANKLFRPYLIAALFNNVMPSSTGGDLVRSYYIYRYSRDAVSALSPVISERVIGLVALLGINVLAIYLTGSIAVVTPALWSMLTTILIIMLVTLLLIGLPVTYWPLHRLLERLSRFRIVAFFLRLGEATHGYLRRPGLLLKVVLYSIVGQLLAVVCYLALARALQVDVRFEVLLVVIPLAFMVASLPISIGGMGVRELTAVGLLTRFGIDATDAAAIALFYIPVVIIASMPGLYYYLRYRETRSMMHDAEEVGIKPQ